MKPKSEKHKGLYEPIFQDQRIEKFIFRLMAVFCGAALAMLLFALFLTMKA